MCNRKYQLCPIGVSTYIRLGHLKQTIVALSKNDLAQDSHLFIFSDAPKPGDEEKVSKLREYIHSIKGFKKVSIIERDKNDRVYNNRDGARQLLQQYSKLIWLEEDNITASGFLCFMNEALDFYKDDPKILSICGYTPPLCVTTKNDTFILGRFSAWGVGITKNNYDKVKAIPSDAIDSIDEPRMAKYGDDIFQMVLKEAAGEISAFDVRAMYLQYLEGTMTVYPQQSLVQNIGHDGTGVHCGETNRFNHKELWQKRTNFQFEKNPCIERKIVKANAKFRSSNNAFVSRLKRLVIRKWIILKNKF